MPKKLVILKRFIVQIIWKVCRFIFKYYMKKVIFTFKTYSLDDLDNVQIIIQIFSNSTFEKKKLCAKKNYTE